MSSFSGKIIAITGAASGMGLTTARLLASEGAVISLADLNENGLKEAVKTLQGDQHICTTVDVRKSGSVNAWIEKTVQKLGKLDGAVNMAGVVTPATKIGDESDERFDASMQVNAYGVFHCIRAELNNIKSGGSIVSAASTCGQVGYPKIGSYCASKHAVIRVTRSAARDHPDVRLNCVAPGVINTPMLQNDEDPDDVEGEMDKQCQRRKADPIEVSHVIAFLLRDKASFVTGAVYNVDGGWVC